MTGSGQEMHAWCHRAFGPNLARHAIYMENSALFRQIHPALAPILKPLGTRLGGNDVRD